MIAVLLAMHSLRLDHSPLLSLPAELIHQILGYLSPIELANVSAVCRVLHPHGKDDRLWRAILHDNMPGVALTTPGASPSFRDLYLSLHPYWFLLRQKFWFADSVHTGKLLVTRYSPSRQCIEAYSLVAERGAHTFKLWDWDSDVIIHTFAPRIQLDLNQPVIQLDVNRARPFGSGNRLQCEQQMDLHGGAGSTGLNSMLSLARKLPEKLIGPSTSVWPPLTLPAEWRARNESKNAYRGISHRPSRFSDVNEGAFRLRKWMEFGGRPGVRVGEDVTTFATLPAEAYTPTPQRPWRGIWCGDYSGHGCEFLVILQHEQPGPLPEGAERAMATRRSESVSSTVSWSTAPEAVESDTARDPSVDGVQGEGPSELKQDPTIYGGRLEAVKLTGDPNIPRGEHTFIAPDIGREGLVRVADEEMFKGARIVRSVGHIAGRGFTEDVFIPSQLIMISHDRLAQYWEPYGHVSFYQRVDIDSFLHVD